MKINLQVDADRLTLDDLIAIDEGMTTKPRWIRDLLARFVTNGDGQYMDYDEAKKELGKLTINQTTEAMNQFGEKVKELQAGVVNPPTGNGSS